MALITTIPSLVFPSQVDVLEFSGTAGGALAFVLTLDGAQLLEATYYYNAEGRVSVEGVADLLEPYLRDGALHTLSVTADGNVVAGNVQVLACRVDSADDALTFCKECFLTATRVKTTYAGAKEQVSLLLQEAETLEVFCTWFAEGEFAHTTSTQQLEAGLQTIDVSPPSMEGRTLLDYEVRVGRRTLLLRLRHDYESDPVSLLFRNAWGQMETFHFFGEVEKEVKPTRSSAVVGGAYRNYKVETVPTWKAATRLATGGEELLAEDIAGTLYAERVADHCPVAITDSELKPDNSRYGITDFTLTWREEQAARRFQPAHLVKTFDLTFDETFV